MPSKKKPQKTSGTPMDTQPTTDQQTAERNKPSKTTANSAPDDSLLEQYLASMKKQYGTTDEMIEELRNELAGQPLELPPTTDKPTTEPDNSAEVLEPQNDPGWTKISRKRKPNSSPTQNEPKKRNIDNRPWFTIRALTKGRQASPKDFQPWNTSTVARLIQAAFPDLRIKEIKPSGESTWLLATLTPSDTKTLLEAANRLPKIVEEHLAIKGPDNVKPRVLLTEVVIRNVATDIPERDIIADLKDHGLLSATKARRFKRKLADGTYVPDTLVAVSLDAKDRERAITQGVAIASNRLRCEPLKSKNKPLQCYKCQEFGHIAAKCDKPARCRWCGKTECASAADRTKMCSAEPHCANCDGSHPTMAKSCRIYREKEATQTKKTTETPVKEAKRPAKPATTKMVETVKSQAMDEIVSRLVPFIFNAIAESIQAICEEDKEFQEWKETFEPKVSMLARFHLGACIPSATLTQAYEVAHDSNVVRRFRPSKSK